MHLPEILLSDKLPALEISFSPINNSELPFFPYVSDNVKQCTLGCTLHVSTRSDIMKPKLF